MPDRKALLDSNDTPEDVATLYSWANLHGAKYRDFSASRAQTREKARQRVQEAIEAERRRTRDESEAHKDIESKRAAEGAILAEALRKQEEALRKQGDVAMQQPLSAAPDSAHRKQPVLPPASIPVAPYQPAPADFSHTNLYAPPPAPSYSQPAGQPLYSQQYTRPEQFSQPAGQPLHAPRAQHPGYTAQGESPAAPARDEQFRAREDHYMQVRTPWAPADNRETVARPAWLSAAEQVDAPAQQPLVPPAPEDTLQASRDRLTSRWFALNSVFSGAIASSESIPAMTTQRAPILAVFSLAGGVGKTSLVATLGRALSARGERILLVDTASFGLLPFFFGARDQRPGVLRTFTAPTSNGDAWARKPLPRRPLPRKFRATPAWRAGSLWIWPPLLAPPPAASSAWLPPCSSPSSPT
jgi:hypothetical protein